MSTPQMPQPQGQLPPAKKISPLVWILVGIVGFMFMVAILLGVGGYFFARKIKQAASSPAGVVSMMARMNPDIEVISTDESTGKVTIKDKKTGKIVTMNFEDLKRGKISIEEDGKEAVSIDASGADGKASVDVKTAEGTAHFGAGSDAKAPAWVPAYPGSTPEGVFSRADEKEASGAYSFKTRDGLEQVSKHYQDALKSGGFEVAQMGGGDSSVVTGKSADGKRSVVLTLSKDGDQTGVAVTFTEKK